MNRSGWSKVSVLAHEGVLLDATLGWGGTGYSIRDGIKPNDKS